MPHPSDVFVFVRWVGVAELALLFPINGRIKSRAGFSLVYNR
ncbi:MAG: hypothetical protein ABSE87_03810 [Terracidiphilus sp.]